MPGSDPNIVSQGKNDVSYKSFSPDGKQESIKKLQNENRERK